MKELEISDKQIYLAIHYPFKGVPDLTDKMRCIHCDKVFNVREFKVFTDLKGMEYICCPFAPECNGTVIDWVDV